VSLKNWTITAELIRKGRDGAVAFGSYLLNQTEHEGQTILPISSRRNLFRLIRDAEAINLMRRMNTGGGMVKNFAWSIGLEFPFELQEQQLKEIYQKVMMRFYEYLNNKAKLNLSKEEIGQIISEKCFAVIHKDGSVKNHIHIMAPTVFKGKSIDFYAKKHLYALKMLNNEVVNEVAGFDCLDYQIESTIQHKKRIKKTKYKQQKEIRAQTAEMAQEVYNLLAMLQEQQKAYQEHIERTGEHIPKELKRLETATKQLKNLNTQRALKTLSNSYINGPSPKL